MTTQFLSADIERDEGRKHAAYPDPLTHAAPWTIGVGHTGREVHPGLVWDDAEIDAAKAADIAAVERGLDSAIPWWRQMLDVRQDCLANMGFNMGVHKLLEFQAFLNLCRAGAYGQAAFDLSRTLWAQEVPARAKRIIDQMRSGVRSYA